MKKLHYIFILLIIPLLFLGCTAESLQPPNVKAAEAIPTKRPAEDMAESDTLPDTPPKSCPVTQPPKERFIPRKPFHEYPSAGLFWYGTDALWTAVPIDRTWRSLPYDEETGYTQKLFFWRYDYNWQEEPQPALTVSGRRLDAEAPPLITSTATNGYNPDTESFMLVGADFPTAGCWEINGQYHDDTLTFVIWIAP